MSMIVDADPNSIQKISFTGNLDRVEDATMFFIIEEAKETLGFFQRSSFKVLWFYFVLI